MQRSSSSLYSICLALVITFASFFISWRMVIPQYQENKLALARTDKEVAAAKTKLDSLNMTKDEINDLGSVFDQLFVAMPKDKDEPNTLAEIEMIANLNKLAMPHFDITDAVTSTIQTPDSDGKIVISTTVKGSFADLNKFVKDLEADLKFMSVKSLSFTNDEDGMSMALKVEAYKTPVTATAGASGTAQATAN